MKSKHDFESEEDYLEYLKMYFIGCAISAGKTPLEISNFINVLMKLIKQ